MKMMESMLGELLDQLTDDQRNQPGFAAILPRRFELGVYLQVGVDDFKQAFWTDTPSEAVIAGVGAFLEGAVKNMPAIARDLVAGGYELGAVELLVIFNLAAPVASLFTIPKNVPLSQAISSAVLITRCVMMEPEPETVH